jgi:hypothetical protein
VLLCANMLGMQLNCCLTALFSCRPTHIETHNCDVSSVMGIGTHKTGNCRGLEFSRRPDMQPPRLCCYQKPGMCRRTETNRASAGTIIASASMLRGILSVQRVYNQVCLAYA